MASVGNDTVKYAAHYVKYSRQPAFRSFFLLLFFFVGGRSQLFIARGRKLFMRGEKPLLRTRGMVASRSVYGEAPKRQLRGTPFAVSGSGHTGNFELNH